MLKTNILQILIFNGIITLMLFVHYIRYIFMSWVTNK